MDKVSYALGLSIGNNFKSSGIDSVVMDDFMQGLSDVLEEKAPQ
ncbi:FKBP-type peptidyl-prolyl cis-trans isomerase N-terminal domain-containing protein, partial [Porphyromonas gulae]